MRPQIEQRTIMVFMGMGYEDRKDLVAYTLGKPNVRHDHIDAGQFDAWKADPAIDHDPLTVFTLAYSVERKVHSNFTNAAKRHKY